jgi:hypothetical protein
MEEQKVNNWSPHIRPVYTNTGASEAQISAVEHRLGVGFPVGYADFMRRSNGLECWVGEHWYLALNTLDDVVKHNLTDSMMPRPHDRIVYIGTNGGSEWFAFDYSQGSPSVVAIMAGSDDPEDMELIANSFDGFLQALIDGWAVGDPPRP